MACSWFEEKLLKGSALQSGSRRWQSLFDEKGGLLARGNVFLRAGERAGAFS